MRNPKITERNKGRKTGIRSKEKHTVAEHPRSLTNSSGNPATIQTCEIVP